VQVLRRAAHAWKDIAALTGVSVRTVQRIRPNIQVSGIDNTGELASA
jgi:hypothetical protein